MMASEGELGEVAVTTNGNWWCSRWWSWKPTSKELLAQAEKKILSSIWHLLEKKFVAIGNGAKHIRTISLNTKGDKIPLVMIHGMGAGVGMWILNLESLSGQRPVHAFDLLGFGRSSRTKFAADAMLVEMEFVESVEEWRQQMNLDKFILLGHSLGGFIASSYAIRYPDRISHLILVDPWGFPERPPESERRTPTPGWVKFVASIMQAFNPLAALRAAGPLGPRIVSRFRPDLTDKYAHLFDDGTVSEYVYHCNAQNPSGEAAFKHLTIPIGWAKYPMIRRISDLRRDIPLSVIYGSRSWIDNGVGWQIKYLRNESSVDVKVIKGAGHHVNADKAEDFNATVTKMCNMVDLRLKIKSNAMSKRRRKQTSECLQDKARPRLPRTLSTPAFHPGENTA